MLESEGYRRIAEDQDLHPPVLCGGHAASTRDYYVVRSSQIGSDAARSLSLEVERDQFVYLDAVTDRSKFIDLTLKTWLTQLSTEQREQFVDTLFSILEATNAGTLKELTLNWHRNARIVLRSIREMDEEMRHNISHALGLLFEAAKQTALQTQKKPPQAQAVANKP